MIYDIDYNIIINISFMHRNRKTIFPTLNIKN